MSRYLFFTWSGAGNQPPAIGMAQALARRGHDVVFAGYAAQRDLFERHGFRFLRLERASQLWSRIFPEYPRTAKIDAAWASSAHLDDVPDLLSAIAPDVAVVDCLMFGALAAVEKAEMPAAVLLHSAPGAIMPPGGRLETLLLGPVNRVRDAGGRPAIGSMWEAWASFPTFCTTIAELDPLAARTPPSFRYVGPVFEDLAPSGWQSPWEPDDPRPLVLVSFSSGDDWDQSSPGRPPLPGAGHQGESAGQIRAAQRGHCRTPAASRGAAGGQRDCNPCRPRDCCGLAHSRRAARLPPQCGGRPAGACSAG
jgi:UDP:flavonoid glycosyltransferase YjiC (YdhE family)